MALKKFCRKQGCPNLTDQGYCEAHKQEAQAYDQYRGSAAERGYDSRWRKARLRFLKANPLCIDCFATGVLKPATDVDHEIPHKGDKVLFWDESNWRARCHSHHSRKTATKDGGFKRPVKER